MRIVFRFEVSILRLATSDGQRRRDAQVVLPHGEEVAARWRSAAASRRCRILPDVGQLMDIPPDYPLGSFDYRIAVATRDGRAATFTPPIQKAKTADSRVRIID